MKISREWGTGSVFPRGNGRWCAKLQIPGAKPKYFYGRTEKIAAQKLDEARRRLGLGMPILSDRYTLSQFLDMWLHEVVSQGRESTYQAYQQRLVAHVIPRIGHVPIVRLTPQHVHRMMLDSAETGLAARTVRELRNVLRAALNVALKWGYVERNVAALTEPPKVKKFQAQSLDDEQALALVRHVRGHRLEALFILTLTLGLRRGEVLGLMWDDIDLDGAALQIRRQLQELRGRRSLVELKTESSLRTLAIPQFIVRSLREHRTRQIEQRLSAGSRWQEIGLVFPSEIGTPFGPRNLNREYYPIRDALGLGSLRFHDLRHSAGTILRIVGVELKIVQRILGHANYQTTADIYSPVIPKEMRDAAHQLDLLFGA